MQYSDMDYTLEVSVDANSIMYLMKKPVAKPKKQAKEKVKTGVKKKTTAKIAAN